MKRSRRGGAIAALIFVVMVLVVVEFVSGIRIERSLRYSGTQNKEARADIETPAGILHVNARKSFHPESAGVPIYPGSRRADEDSGSGLLAFDWDGDSHRQLSFLSAKFTTPDSPERVRDFYQTQLPHGIVMYGRGADLTFEFSREGYKRIIAIDERGDGTHIAIAAFGGADIN